MSTINQTSGANEESIALRRVDRCRRTATVVKPVVTECSTSPGHRIKKRSVFRRTENLTSLEKTLHSFQETDAAKKILGTRLKCSSLAASIMGLLAVVMAVADLELVVRVEKHRNSNSLNFSNKAVSSKDISFENKFFIASIAVKCVITILSVLTCGAIYITYSTQLRLFVVKNTYPETDSLVTASFFPKYLLETIACFFHVPPFAVQYGFNYKFQLVVIARLYLVLRYIKEHNRFTNSNSTGFLASVTNTEMSPVFLVKMLFMKQPFRLIFIFYSLNVFLGGYVVYVLEDTHSYLDTIWMLVVTMTTLGFGDVVPVSTPARAIVGFASVLGIFLMALFISVVHENLQLSQHEKRILAYIENAEHNLAVKTTAAQCIQTYWKFSSFVGKNRAALNRGAWMETQKYKLLQHRLFKVIRSWRSIRHRWSRDDYWRKFFVAEDTAMLLTDVSRSVETVANILQRSGSLQRSRSSLRKHSSTVIINNQPPPSIFEEPEPPATENKVNKSMSDDSCFIQVRNPANQMPDNGNVCSRVEIDNENFSQEERNLFAFENTNRQPNETDLIAIDHIDKGTIAVDSINMRLDTLGKSVDHILEKVKSELRDIQEAIKTIDLPRSPYSLSSSKSASPNVGQNSVQNGRAGFVYPQTLKLCDV